MLQNNPSVVSTLHVESSLQTLPNTARDATPQPIRLTRPIAEHIVGLLRSNHGLKTTIEYAEFESAVRFNLENQYGMKVHEIFMKVTNQRLVICLFECCMQGTAKFDCGQGSQSVELTHPECFAMAAKLIYRLFSGDRRNLQWRVWPTDHREFWPPSYDVDLDEL